MFLEGKGGDPSILSLELDKFDQWHYQWNSKWLRQWGTQKYYNVLKYDWLITVSDSTENHQWHGQSSGQFQFLTTTSSDC